MICLGGRDIVHHTFESTRLRFIGIVGIVLTMSTFGVIIEVICQTMFLSDRENSIFSKRSTKMTSEKNQKNGQY
jgi:hypothetical protein